MIRRNFLKLPILLLFKPKFVKEITNIERVVVDISWPIRNIWVCGKLKENEEEFTQDIQYINVEITSNGDKMNFKGKNESEFSREIRQQRFLAKAIF